MRERIIYNNYDLWEDYADDARAFLAEEYPEEEITDNSIWDEIYFQDNINWEDEHERLKDFFTGNGYFMIRGYVGRWDGRHAAGYVFDDFDDMFYQAVKDCDYIKMWDENGRFYLKCSHHDGTNLFEIKRINQKAYEFIDNWSYSWDDDRTEAEIHSIVWNSNFLSSLPHFAHTVYGCKKREGKTA